MKKAASFWVISFTVMTIISFCCSVKADYLYAYTVQQAKSMWCWAATAENAIHYEYYPTRDQWDAVYHIKGWPLNPYPDVGGSLSDSIHASEYISSGTEDYSYASYGMSYAFLTTQIDSYDNYIELSAGYYDENWNRIGGHIVAMNGVNPSGSTLEYVDPWDNLHYECTYSSFCDGSFNDRIYDGAVYNTET